MVAFSAEKRSLFRRFSARSGDNIRPPWSVDEYQFVESCQDCKACSETCPENIIQLDSRQQPVLNFHKGECTFCADCISVCEKGALYKATDDALPWNAIVMLNRGCLSEQNTLCRSCGEVCEHEVLRFPLSAGGIVSPEINEEKCNGCGACIAICPTRALEIRYQ
ncbi:MAG: ferredoxin-type protein NapF [Gammaproteobacteria bacterium]|nr:ferredoxin-type protein NapF [Gammaproteobacteria bacterium]